MQEICRCNKTFILLHYRNCHCMLYCLYVILLLLQFGIFTSFHVRHIVLQKDVLQNKETEGFEFCTISWKMWKSRRLKVSNSKLCYISFKDFVSSIRLRWNMWFSRVRRLCMFSFQFWLVRFNIYHIYNILSICFFKLQNFWGMFFIDLCPNSTFLRFAFS